MKRCLETGKLWTLLSVFLFVMTCGIFVTYAATSSKFYTEYSAETMGNTLTAEGWDSMMKNLDKIIPDGAVMPILTGECPEGWNEFTGAEGRFLMGANLDIRGWGGSNTLTEVIKHNHKVKYRNRYHATDNANTIGYVVDWISGDLPSGVIAPGSWDGGTVKFNVETVGNSSGVDITNKYVKVRFCVKGNYNLKEDYCEGGGYSSEVPSCGEWYWPKSKLSKYGSFKCWTCRQMSCSEYGDLHNMHLERCEESPLPGGTATLNNPFGQICVKEGCCKEAEASVPVADECRSLYNN